jgi:hypothetical protein
LQKTGFEMKKEIPLKKKPAEEFPRESSSAGSVSFLLVCDNLSPPIFRHRLGLAISCALLLLEAGCVTVMEPAPGNYGQQASADVAPAEEYQPPPPEVMTVYESDLNPYGSWVTVDGYGQCWAPNDRPAGWEPYTVGYWVDTDYGWTWVAVDDESQWGDVTYHYGRWYNAPSDGWVWIPGTTWAPAWVAWREGGGYCAWAPLPPQAGFGTRYSAADADRYVPSNQYVYCDERYATSGRVDQHIVRNDETIINKTTNITNITYVDNHVVNQGMPAANVARATGHAMQPLMMSTAATPDEARSFAAAGKPVIYAPPIVQQAEKQRVADAKTPAQNPKPMPSPQTSPPQAASVEKMPVAPSEQKPPSPDKEVASTKDQPPVKANQTIAASNSKGAQDQSDPKSKTSTDPKAKAPVDPKAKAKADAKAKAAAAEKAKNDHDAEKPPDKSSGQ